MFFWLWLVNLGIILSFNVIFSKMSIFINVIFMLEKWSHSTILKLRYHLKIERIYEKKTLILKIQHLKMGQYFKSLLLPSRHYTNHFWFQNSRHILESATAPLLFSCAALLSGRPNSNISVSFGIFLKFDVRFWEKTQVSVSRSSGMLKFFSLLNF